jgi:hypothetical protein
VKVADISDIIAGRHEDDALLVLKIICGAIVENNTEGVLEEVCGHVTAALVNSPNVFSLVVRCSR